jgi:hypothetical protein
MMPYLCLLYLLQPLYDLLNMSEWANVREGISWAWPRNAVLKEGDVEGVEVGGKEHLGVKNVA